MMGRKDLNHRHHIIAQCEHMGLLGAHGEHMDPLARHKGLAVEHMGLLEHHMVLEVHRDRHVRHMELLEHHSHDLEHQMSHGLDHASPFVILKR